METLYLCTRSSKQLVLINFKHQISLCICVIGVKISCISKKDMNTCGCYDSDVKMLFCKLPADVGKRVMETVRDEK